MLNDASPTTLTRTDGSTIAYHRHSGKSPGVVFMTGFKSDMTGGKALALESFCRRRGNAFLRFDYTGHGQSSGAFIDGTIGQWADDAVAALDNLTDGPQVLVGSSMGGWIMLLAAMARPSRIAGLLGIAAAPDFTEDLIRPALLPADREQLESQGTFYLQNSYGEEPTPLTRALLEDGSNHLVLRNPIALDVPVRLIHGQKDDDVPWRTAVTIADRITSDDVEITLVKNAGHRLSEDADIVRLLTILDDLLDTVED